jgi:hypothetical protein
MNVPDRGELRSASGGLHLQISKLLTVAIVAAIAATGALIITLLVGLPSPPPGRGPEGQPPPPPDLSGLAMASVVTGLFVLTWLAVLIVYSRDQILRRLGGPPEGSADTAGRIREDIAALGDRLAAMTTEYGEQRETDGYLNGMRAATARPPDAVVTPLRRTPPHV